MPRQQYEDVAAKILEKIESGEYPPGSKLPSRQEMRVIFGASDTVIDKAMMLVRMRGVTETLPGVGVFVRETT